MRLLLVTVLLAASAGCSWSPHARDQRTIDDVATTIEHRQRDVARAARYLAAASTLTARPEDGAALAREARNLELLNATEEARLRAWGWREQQKSDQ